MSIFKETNRQIDTDRQTGRWADRQTGIETRRQTGRQADRQVGRDADGYRDRQVEGRRTGGHLSSSETDRQSQTDKLRDRHEQPGRQKDTDRQKDRHRAERRTDRPVETYNVTDGQIA